MKNQGNSFVKKGFYCTHNNIVRVGMFTSVVKRNIVAPLNLK